MNCIAVNLGDEGLAYVRRQLAFGHSLAAFLLQLTHQESGEVTARLPRGSAVENVLRFDSGGIGSVNEARDCLAALVLDELKRPDRVCLFEDALGERQDPGTQRIIGDHCFHEEVIYHYVLSESAEERDVFRALQEAETLPVFVAAVCRVPTNASPLSPNCELTATILGALAFQAERILIGAYDGEGYVVWSRTSPGQNGLTIPAAF